LIEFDDGLFARFVLLDIYPIVFDELLAEEFLRSAAIWAPLSAVNSDFWFSHVSLPPRDVENL